MFQPREFFEGMIRELRSKYGGVGNILAAVSGGVDSTTAAVITYKALGDRVKPVFIDTGFMRLNEGAKVKELLSSLIPIQLVDYSSRFYSRLQGLSDAEVKRKVFREVFYEVIKDLAMKYGCEYVVQGTIAPDWIETLGGIKTQHNVLTDELLSRYGFKVIEPLRELYKDQVRLVAKHLGIPDEIVYRQPFPGPGLLVRAVGAFSLEKLEVVRRATEVVEGYLSGRGISQYFPAVWEYDVVGEGRVCSDICINYKIFSTKATGVRGDRRVYRPIALIENPGNLDLTTAYKYFEDVEVSHVILLLNDRGYGKYFISIRAVVTEDFMTADIYRPSYNELIELSRELIKISGVRAVGYDITPKPPATIEYE